MDESLARTPQVAICFLQALKPRDLVKIKEVWASIRDIPEIDWDERCALFLNRCPIPGGSIHKLNL